MKKSIIAFVVIGVCVVGIAILLKTNSGSSPAVREDAGSKPNRVELPVVDAEPPKVDLPIPVQAHGQPEPKPMVSDAVRGIIDPAAGYRERLEAMRGLGYNLSSNDVADLMGFLNEPMPENAELRSRAYNSIRNDVVDILLKQQSLPDHLGQMLTSVYNDPNHDDMWRNYCIQFMEPYYERQARELGGETASSVATVPHELQSVQNTLWEATGERDNSNAGTALLAMDKLSRNHPEFKQEEITAAALNLAQDEQATVANRVTALRLCGEHKNGGALETARDLARNSDVTMLRCAAIATLGDIGTEEDLALLETYAVSNDKRIASIAKVALENQPDR